jgi:fructuronate reductase
MTGTPPPLSRRTVPPGLLRPSRAPDEAGIVHIGLGNFHRAHQAVYTAHAVGRQPGPWGIIGVAPRSRGITARLRGQDHLYTVLELAPGRVHASVPGVLVGSLAAADAPDAVADAIAAPGTRIVTLTVTEKGYSYSAASRGLDFNDARVLADLRQDGPASTVIGQIARGLERRIRAHGAPLAILSCDNLAHNGAHTRRLVTEFISALPPGIRDELLPWMAESVAFPSSMVDRIVPATTDAHRALVSERFGVSDSVPVPAEPFSMWVMEDSFPAGRPEWEAGGAMFSDNVADYEALKLRLLNGTHSLIAYLGLLSGHRDIAAAVRVPEIERTARCAIAEDYLPTLHVPDGVDVRRYTEELFSRFGNQMIGHQSATVASDGSLKLPVRITEPLRFHASRGRVPRHIALTVAAYIRCLAVPGSYDHGALGWISDPAADRLAVLGSGCPSGARPSGARPSGARPSGARPSGARLAQAVFAESGIFVPEVNEQAAFVEAVGELLDALDRYGVAGAIAAAQGSALPGSELPGSLHSRPVRPS